MRKTRKKSFEELVKENKQQLLQDQQALDLLEERWEQRILKRLDSF
ncbi:FbpB family small basic protein [Bacillus sp. J37]|nr:FbpB family small basic protein [Bacillus sp. J37]